MNGCQRSRQRWDLLVRSAALCLVCLVLVLLLVPPHPLQAQDGRAELSLSVRSAEPGFNRLTAGEDNLFLLAVRNTGQRTISEIRLSTLHPEGWETSFSEETVASLAPDTSRTIDVNILPPADAASGDQRISFVAEADDTREVTVFWVDVQAPQGYWLWIGGILGVVVVAGFVLVFLRLGRQ